MRKLLLAILLILLVFVAGLTMKNGISIGSLQIKGFQGIAEENQQLTLSIENAQNKENEYLNEVLPKITSDTANLSKAKKDYLDLVTVSTTSEIQQALQSKTYSIEYLWSIVGNYATKEGVVTKMEVSSSNVAETGYRNLNFTVTGSYLAMTNFIYDLENDSNLDFTIDNFSMTSKQCTFVVKDIKIKKELSSTSTTTKANSTNKTSESGTTESTDNNTEAAQTTQTSQAE